MATKFFYQFRDITEAEAKLAASILRSLFRRGRLVAGEGHLANYCRLNMTDELFQAVLAKLEQYDAIAIATGFTSRRITLTGTGSDYAAELIGKEQIVEADKVDREYKAGIRKMQDAAE
jgi:hypothetical protein